MSRYEQMQIRDLENLITKYINDASGIALGVPMHKLGCWLDGIATAEALAVAIKAAGAAYQKKMRELRNAAIVLREKSIGHLPGAEPAPNAPSVEDEAFIQRCIRTLRNRGFVLASDADRYEEIAKKYPNAVPIPRVRGSEARRYLALRDDPVGKALKKKARR